MYVTIGGYLYLVAYCSVRIKPYRLIPPLSSKLSMIFNHKITLKMLSRMTTHVNAPPPCKSRGECQIQQEKSQISSNSFSTQILRRFVDQTIFMLCTCTPVPIFVLPFLFFLLEEAPLNMDLRRCSRSSWVPW